MAISAFTFLFGNVYDQSSPVHRFTIHCQCGFGILLGGECDECKAPRLAAVSIRNQADFIQLSVIREKRFHVGLGSGKGKIADK